MRSPSSGSGRIAYAAIAGRVEVVNEQDLPMNPRLLGKPGVGKTTLAYAAGKRMGRDVYILQATMDTPPGTC